MLRHSFSRGEWAWNLTFLGVLAWSAVWPHDRFTWWLEVLPAIIAAVVLLLLHGRVRLTALLYWLILLHCIILMVGGHYTYAEVPLFDWIRDQFGQNRNNYDKVGHFAQGFVPAILAREILIRNRVVSGRYWLALFVVSVCLAFSAFYELLEWWVAELSGGAADDFLGTQGYIWDTQSDMMWALTGAVAALIFLSGLHDKQLSRLEVKTT
ncbi:MAG: DUF2238 domain-containing protein [Pseudomonadota bacterium]